MHILSKNVEPWRVTLVDTGQDTMTGGRLLAAREHLEDDTFCMTYGDGVGNIDIARTVAFHQQHRCHATLTAVQAPGRFGSLRLDDEQVYDFVEKPLGDGAWINGGFFVLAPSVLDYIDGSRTVWEREPLSRLAADGHLMAYKHSGFWQPMDTLRDKHHLENLWQSGHAPWRVWNCGTHSGKESAYSLPDIPALKVAG
jgi:glucose-1-phosphate cytidylyltransferase